MVSSYHDIKRHSECIKFTEALQESKIKKRTADRITGDHKYDSFTSYNRVD